MAASQLPGIDQEDRDFAAGRMFDALRDRLQRECPCCNAMLFSTATGDDGLADGRRFEARYLCGGAVQIDTGNELHVTAGCQRELTNSCADLWTEEDGEREDFLDELSEMRATDAPAKAEGSAS